MTWAWQQATVSSGERLVLLALADHAGEDGECWPHSARLAAKCSLTPKVVQRHLSALHERGLITKVERRKRPNGTLSGWLYRLEIERPNAGGGAVDGPSERGAGRPHERGALEPVLEGPSVYPLEPTVEPSERTVTVSLSQNTVTEAVPDRVAAVAEVVTEVEVLDDFDAFWRLYPRKVGKPKCRQRWARMSPAARRDALDALPVHLEHWRVAVSDPRFIPHPLTWLNGERWTDDLTVDFEVAPPAGKTAPGMDMVRRLLAGSESGPMGVGQIGTGAGDEF